ncbi:hypothetical protein ACL1HS_02795 [Corynebacterium striatum]
MHSKTGRARFSASGLDIQLLKSELDRLSGAIAADAEDADR